MRLDTFLDLPLRRLFVYRLMYSFLLRRTAPTFLTHDHLHERLVRLCRAQRWCQRKLNHHQPHEQS